MTSPTIHQRRKSRRRLKVAQTDPVSRTPLRWPSRNFFAEIDTPDLGEGHPLHQMLHREPRFRRLYRRVVALGRRVEPQVKAKDWMALMDSRSVLNEAEIQAAFNLGFENGVLLGRADGLKRIGGHRDRREEDLRRTVRSLLMKVNVPHEEAALMLLELAWALVMGEPIFGPPRARAKKRRATRH
jgi:hypothetical protein